jgi:ATP-dependent DNA helicase RecG
MIAGAGRPVAPRRPRTGKPRGGPDEDLPGVPPATRTRLRALGIQRWQDLLLHLPLRYEDETRLSDLAEAHAGDPVHLELRVSSHEIAFRGRRTLRVLTQCGPHEVSLRFLNFYPSQLRQFEPGTLLRAAGELRLGFHGLELVHPRYRAVTPDAPLAIALTPIYPTTAGLTQGTLRKLTREALARASPLQDSLPDSVRRELDLENLESTLRMLHEPPPGTSLAALEERSHPAWQRLKFDELLAQQLSMRRHRSERRQQVAPVLAGAGSLVARLRESLPFALTAAQERALQEIGNDLALAHPMQRLLQGDVGSGKTIVAALACAQALDHGCQAVLLAPTEILAEQHFQKIAAMLSPLGVRCAWVTGSQKRRDRDLALAALADGSAQLAIGTHALLEAPVQFARLGLVVIDEQHRFGVEQRLALRRKGEQAGTGQPHQLMMSATPIPRTLSMSYFADLDVSVIDELPPGRTAIRTKLVDTARRQEIFERVHTLCASGEQAYWVCPLVEESESLDLQTAMDAHVELREAFPELSVGLVHGRLPAAEKAAVMQAFGRNEIQLLVATTVIEVGVDVPNATLMVIEHSERMGLAQLHQLRGRVGRGGKQGWCILLFQRPLSELARARLKVIFELTDGFAIAREDLRLRGPGEFLGARQSGAPLLRFADLDCDLELLEAARRWADRLLAQDPEVARDHLERWLGSRADYLKA